MLWYLVPLLALLHGQVIAQLPAISAKGSKLFTSDGAQFYNKGIAYQPSNADPLANAEQCKLDAALMKTLNANAIRVYHVNPQLNHDACMTAFSDAGIYAWIDLDTFSTYIIPQGETQPQWNHGMFEAYQKVMDAFQGYSNTAGFFVGNEMLTDGPSSVAAPYLKAAARDMKAYRNRKGYRNIPVGYSAADIPALRPNLQNYLACGDDSADAVDFYSLNAYEWCGESSYDVSGYVFLQQNASEYNIPIFMSETGCNKPEPRLFDDQTALLGPQMDNTWSGAIIYEWVEAVNNYGLISYGPVVAPTVAASNVVAGYSIGGTPTPISPDFTNLQSQWASLNPTGTSENAYTPSLTPPACPPYTSGFWEVSGNVPLPKLASGGTGYTYATASAQPPPTSSSSSSSSGGSGSGSGNGSGSGSGSKTSSGSAAAATGSIQKVLKLTKETKIVQGWHHFAERHPLGAWLVKGIYSSLCLTLFIYAVFHFRT